MGETIARQRSGNEEAKKEPYGGLQGEGGVGGAQGRQDAGGAVREVGCPASQIVQWKTQLLEAASAVFLTPAEKRESQGPSATDMQAKIGQLALENVFWHRRARSHRRCERKEKLKGTMLKDTTRIINVMAQRLRQPAVPCSSWIRFDGVTATFRRAEAVAWTDNAAQLVCLRQFP